MSEITSDIIEYGIVPYLSNYDLWVIRYTNKTFFMSYLKIMKDYLSSDMIVSDIIDNDSKELLLYTRQCKAHLNIDWYARYLGHKYIGKYKVLELIQKHVPVNDPSISISLSARYPNITWDYSWKTMNSDHISENRKVRKLLRNAIFVSVYIPKYVKVKILQMIRTKITEFDDDIFDFTRESLTLTNLVEKVAELDELPL